MTTTTTTSLYYTCHCGRTTLDEPSINYLKFCRAMVPTKSSIRELEKLAGKVPTCIRVELAKQVRIVAVERCLATLNRIRSDKYRTVTQRKAYERYYGLAQKGESLMELTLVNAPASVYVPQANLRKILCS